MADRLLARMLRDVASARASVALAGRALGLSPVQAVR